MPCTLTCISRTICNTVTRVKYFCNNVRTQHGKYTIFTACTAVLVQCGPLEVRNRSQAYTVLGQGSAMRTCDGQRVKEFQHSLSCQGLETPFRCHWGRIEAWCEFDNAFGPWASLVMMSAFALALARPCDFISPQYSMSMWLSFRPSLATLKMIF